MGRALAAAILLLGTPALLQPPASAPGRDRVRLVTGEVLEGRILAETPTMVEIELGRGMVVGLEKRRAVEIVRSETVEAAAEAAAEPRLLAPRDQHFLVLDGDGRAVAARRIRVLEERRPAGGWEWRLEEEWTFPGGPAPLRLFRTETAAADLKPLACSFRESRGDQDRIVRGQVRREILAVDVLGPSGRRQGRLPFPAGCRFPLLLRETLRQRERQVPQRLLALVYDPMEDQFRQVQVQTGLVRGPVRGALGDLGVVAVLREDRDGRAHEEWLDASGRILYEEVNGLDLAAVPVPAAAAADFAAGRLDPAGLPELWRPGRPGLRLPDPSWRLLADGSAGAESSELQARLRALPLPGLGQTPLIEAARALARSLALELGELQGVECVLTPFSWAQAVRVSGRIGPRGGEEVVALVLPGPEEPQAYVLTAPARQLPRAAGALERAASRALAGLSPAAGPGR